MKKHPLTTHRSELLNFFYNYDCDHLIVLVKGVVFKVNCILLPCRSAILCLGALNQRWEGYDEQKIMEFGLKSSPNTLTCVIIIGAIVGQHKRVIT